MATTRPYLAALGKRKTARARVKMFQDGSGEVMVNGMKLKEYFNGFSIENAIAPLLTTDLRNRVDIEVMTSGGGKAAQSDAIRLGISRALLLLNPDFHRP
jgi:small subunit ribosomal protein S9